MKHQVNAANARIVVPPPGSVKGAKSWLGLGMARWRRLAEQFGRKERGHAIADTINDVEFALFAIERQAGRPHQPRGGPANHAARRHVAVVGDAPYADEAGLLAVPGRRLGGVRTVRVAIVFYRDENIALLGVHVNLADAQDAGMGAGDDGARRYVAIIGAVKD